MVRLGALLILASCSFTPGSAPKDGNPIDVPPPDDATDAPADSTDAPAACVWEFPPSNVDPCDAALPAATTDLQLTTGGWLYNSDTNELRSPAGDISNPPSALVAQGGGGPMLRVIVLANFTTDTGSLLRASGAAPVVILVDGTAKLGGNIGTTAGANAGCAAAQSRYASDT